MKHLTKYQKGGIAKAVQKAAKKSKDYSPVLGKRVAPSRSAYNARRRALKKRGITDVQYKILETDPYGTVLYEVSRSPKSSNKSKPKLIKGGSLRRSIKNK
tara:strand:- start:268 stop:570 length:303 start_codon:yes stop_codon:yes gene_type:complete